MECRSAPGLSNRTVRTTLSATVMMADERCPVESPRLNGAIHAVEGRAVDALERNPIAGRQEHRLLAALIEHPKRGAADEVPAARTLEGIDRGPVHDDGDRGARHAHTRLRASRQHQ